MPDPEQSMPVVRAERVEFERSYPAVEVAVRWKIVCPHCCQVHLHAPTEGPALGHCHDASVRAAYVIVAPEGGA